MIPVKLTIQGLYSYRQRQTILFDNLTSAGLFGLFGGVGSGKSTILEAISFALYGESERLNRNDNRNYNMMNLKSNELLIDFEFKTGTNDRYRFSVSGRRNGKRFDDVKTFDRAAYKLVNDQWQPLADTTAEKVTGLSYDNFRRTIIIPQGKFQEFLQLSPKDRTSMLMELFNLEKYDLAGKVGGMEARNNGQMENLKGQLAALGNIEPAQIEQLKTQLTDFTNELKVLGEEIVSHQKEVQVFEKTKELQAKMVLQQQRVEGLEKQQDDMAKLDHDLKEYERLVVTFQADLEFKKSLVAKRSESEQQLKIDAEKFDADSKKRLEIKEKFDKIKIEFAQKDELLKQADELTKIAQITGFATKRQELATRTENGTKLLAEKTEGLAKHKADALALKEVHAQARQSMPNMAVLADVKQWFANQTNFEKSRSDMQKRIEQHQQAIVALQRDLVDLMKPIFPATNAQTTIIEHNDNLTRTKEESKKQRNLLQQKKTHAEVSRRLQSFANNLADGAACPLCGSTHHPDVYSAAHVSDEIAQLDAQLAHTDAHLALLEVTQTKLAQIDTLWQTHQKQLADDQLKLTELTGLMEQHAARFVWPTYSPNHPQLVDDHFVKAQETTKVIEQQAKQIDESAKLIDKEEAEKEKYAKALEQIERERLALSSQIETLTAQIALLKPSDFTNLTATEIDAQASTLRKQHDELVANYNAADRQLQSLNQTIDLLSGKLEANKKTFSILAQELETIDLRIAKNVKEANVPSLMHVEAVLQQKPDVTAGRQRIDQWRHDMAAARELMASLQRDLQGHTYDETAHKQSLIKLSDAIEKANRLNQSIGDTANQIKRLEADLAKQAQLHIDLEKLQLRAANLTELKNMFRSSGFVNYVSTVYLQNLCAAANDRFYRLTRQHLSLELADDNTFQVRDFMNEGKIRSVKTLSGGQTFQASLSLALALADSVRHLSAGHENFFFLDEGFGTLDRESLSVVFDTLKSLRKENRIVGVISHVDEMQQEIQTYLRIVNSEETGSVVVGSWEE